MCLYYMSCHVLSFGFEMTSWIIEPDNTSSRTLLWSVLVKCCSSAYLLELDRSVIFYNSHYDVDHGRGINFKSN